MCFTLRAKFEVSNIIPTSFRPVGGGGRVGVVLPSTPPQNKPLKIPSSLELNTNPAIADFPADNDKSASFKFKIKNK